MVFHQKHAHGRVFHGLEAREMLEQKKRDSHGNNIKLNVPETGTNLDKKLHAGTNLDNKLRFIHNAINKAEVDPNAETVVQTVYSQVYVTQPNTYTGDVVWVTQSTPPAATPTQDAAASYASAKSLQNNPTPTYTHAKGSPLQASRVASSTVEQAVGGTPLTTSREPSAAKGTPLQASHKPDDVIAQKGHGMSGGAKAGVAFGVILALGLCAGLAFFCWRRRKNQVKKGEQLDEKHASQNSFFSGTAAAMNSAAGNVRRSIQSEKSFTTTHTAATAPRLSLRPVTQTFTQFLPSIMGNRTEPTGNSLAVPAMSEKPRGTGQNPFTDAAVVSEKQARSESPAANPFEDNVDAAATGNVRSTPTHSANNSWEGGEMGTPKSTQVGTASAVAVGAAGARQPNNVHRVQLEFKPSMDDELELKSGQLVRMLHAYDDGWALCIRMDRSQQGVCPRTCLSKLPVKPRPQGPPSQTSPNGRPAARGPPPPGVGPNGMMPRPLTPTGRERSSTGPRVAPPAPQETQRSRSQSVSGVSDGVPARKPVPGQAM